MKILDGENLADAVRDMLENHDYLRFAVAFWGPIAAAQARARRARIVLDISMGGTSRNALRALGVPKNPNAKVLDGLHAKLYVSSSQAIICSANASRNALGTDARAPVLREAGVLVERKTDKRAYDDAVVLFRKYWRAGQVAKSADLKRAVKVPRTYASRDVAPRQDKADSLLEALLADPVPFAGTVFIFGDAGLETNDEKRADRAYAKTFEHDKGPGRRQIICATDDEGYDLLLQKAAFVLMYWFGNDQGLCAYFDIVRVPAGKGMIAFYGRKNWSTVRSRLGISRAVGVSDCWETDEARAREIAADDGDAVGARFVIQSAEEACERLGRESSV